MKKIILFLLASMFLCVPFQSRSQEDYNPVAPNYKLIKKNIAKANGLYYYPTLKQRFLAGDTTLLLEQLRHLYYGEVFQPGYSGYSKNGESKIHNILKQDSLLDSDWQRIVAIADSNLPQVPTSMRLYYYKWMAQAALHGEQSPEARQVQWQLSSIVDVLFSSGNGMTFEMAVHVTNVSHEYVFMNIMGFQSTGQSLQYHKKQAYDVMKVAENEFMLKELYFNADQILKHGF